ncbi:hypothetical protein [Pseudogemmobacter humi]|uniref:MobA/MobL family protein n=1 Tax=Pseudogemmobacter humi TaxID=2483812 RepID=A0A3P5WZJ5_9RHOB|nr:hypothetical protein [Pseudogemmobacter humi]VDC28615.1 hypothetical protein XINFAN_02183 [Pseudogemmobacter humi]
MGKAGSYRAHALDASSLTAMEHHELRLDEAGRKRSIRKDAQGRCLPPLLYNPYGKDLSLTQSYEAHVAGARRNKGAGKLCLHAFIQFPTDLEITPETQQGMLDEAVRFVNRTHGGDAVFRARIDRDEAGQHGVDVFFAPKYLKATKRRSETWISLTRFGKERAVERFGHRQAVDKDKEAGQVVPLFSGPKGDVPVMVPCDSRYYQGRAFQDLWFEHLRDEVGLPWVERGKAKIGRDPDRLQVEEYKAAQERLKAVADAELIRERARAAGRAEGMKEAADALEVTRILLTGDLSPQLSTKAAKIQQVAEKLRASRQEQRRQWEHAINFGLAVPEDRGRKALDRAFSLFADDADDDLGQAQRELSELKREHESHLPPSGLQVGARASRMIAALVRWWEAAATVLTKLFDTHRTPDPYRFAVIHGLLSDLPDEDAALSPIRIELEREHRIVAVAGRLDMRGPKSEGHAGPSSR